MKFAISILFLICLSAGVYSQASGQECDKNPATIILTSPDLRSDPDFDEALRNISKNLEKDEKLFIYAYSKGAFGTSGLNTITGTMKSRAEHILKSEKRYDVQAAGYRFEASADLFVLDSKCGELTEEYRRAPGLSFFEVDFADAPLGLSIFPSI